MREHKSYFNLFNVNKTHNDPHQSLHKTSTECNYCKHSHHLHSVDADEVILSVLKPAVGSVLLSSSVKPKGFSMWNCSWYNSSTQKHESQVGGHVPLVVCSWKVVCMKTSPSLNMTDSCFWILQYRSITITGDCISGCTCVTDLQQWTDFHTHIHSTFVGIFNGWIFLYNCCFFSTKWMGHDFWIESYKKKSTSLCSQYLVLKKLNFPCFYWCVTVARRWQ